MEYNVAYNLLLGLTSIGNQRLLNVVHHFFRCLVQSQLQPQGLSFPPVPPITLNGTRKQPCFARQVIPSKLGNGVRK